MFRNLLISLLGKLHIVKTRGIDEVVELQTPLAGLSDERECLLLSHLGDEEGHPSTPQGIPPYLAVQPRHRGSLYPLQ